MVWQTNEKKPDGKSTGLLHGQMSLGLQQMEAQKKEREKAQNEQVGDQNVQDRGSETRKIQPEKETQTW